MSILDDIHECAAEMEAQALQRLTRYKGYTRYEREALDDLTMARRVMEWVDLQHERDES